MQPPTFSYSSTWHKYYFAGSSRVAVRTCAGTGTSACSEVSYLLSDHLGSTSMSVSANGELKTSQIMYKPWGEIRYSSSTSTALPTNYTFTGQFSYMDDPTTTGVTEGFGLMFYNARMYDPAIGRFTSADSILADPVFGWDRYAYVTNNPLSYADPSGHDPECTIRCVAHEVLELKKLSGAGQNLYRTYLKMWKSDGWWWDEYGGDGAFTIDEFMAINWHYEQANFGNLKEYNLAVQNAAAMWSATACKNTSYSCDLSTSEGSLNFLGYYSQTSRDRAKRCAISCHIDKEFNPTVWGKDAAAKLVDAISETKPRTQFGVWEWFSVGNVSMNEQVYKKMIKKGWAGIVVGGGNPMMILSYCQATFAWWAIRQGNSNHSSPMTYLTGKNYRGFCNE